MPRVLVAPDKFKGTLTAAEVAAHLSRGIREGRPDAQVVEVPVADGGDGTLDAAIAAGFTRVPLRATGPTGMPRATAFALKGREAVVELAAVSGLAQLPHGRPDPMGATSRGTGELIAAALDAGARRVVLGLGGSACTDGGAGLLQALGARVLGADAEPAPAGGGGLGSAVSLDLSGLNPLLRAAELVVACDVDNPLTGERGAAAVYGPQKGATRPEVEALEAALGHWADLVEAATGVDLRLTPGAGAAGGVAFAVVAALGGVLRPGADLVFDLVGLHGALEGCALVVTGEGSLDRQTLHGKAPSAVASAARTHAIPVVAVAGQVRLAAGELAAAGIGSAYALTEEATRPGQEFSEPGLLLERVGARIARTHLALPSAHPADEEARA